MEMSAEKLLNWFAILVIPVVIFALSPFWTSLFADKKTLEYWTVEKTRINDETFGVSAKAWPELKATYKGRSIDDATFVTFTFGNTGGAAIKREDFEGPIIFVTNEPKKALEFRIVTSYPPSLTPKLKIIKEGLELQPLLLNPGDGFTVELFAASNFDLKEVTGRITGVQSISEYVRDMYTGLQISQVREKAYGRSSQREILRLPAYAIGIATVAFFMLSIVALRLNRLATQSYARIIVSVLCAILYGMGILSAYLLPSAVFAESAPSWAYYVIFSLIAAAPIVLGIRASGRLVPESVKQKSEI